ncbi:hypothetical protein ANN_21570 [Periplaneta americana]|uniref:Uncharacterized protein n=1 Tax=Periplaneta americana TaxID=6978 RepID=A0ABQ8S677_PERAM|nr:hypothetical protein ANN_21570 [Periplaneta americana]
MLGFRVMAFKPVIFTGTFFFLQVGAVTEDINRVNSEAKGTLSVVFSGELCNMYSNQKLAEVHLMYGMKDDDGNWNYNITECKHYTITEYFPRNVINLVDKFTERKKSCAVSSTQKFLVQQHITTSKHQANKQLNSKQRQLFLTQPTTSNEQRSARHIHVIRIDKKLM